MTVTVAFKTLAQANFNLDLDDDATIADVKLKVAEGRGDEFAPELQKLIYNGKILEDATKVSEVGFEKSKFVVVMLARKKVAEAPAPAVSAAAETPKATAPPATESAPANPEPTPAPAVNFTAEQEQSIEAITGMGYPRDQAIAALRAAYWNADRAVEFMLNGIPDGVAEDDALMDDAPAAGGQDELAPGSLDALRNLPQLDEIRTLVQQNPEMLAIILQQLATVNPSLVQAIQSNQQAFIDMLNAPPGADEAGAAAGGGARAGGNPVRRQQGGQLVIELSPEEMAAVNRIKDMGLPIAEAAIVEAYLACDKNEEAAVDFLLSGMEDA